MFKCIAEGDDGTWVMGSSWSVCQRSREWFGWVVMKMVLAEAGRVSVLATGIR